MRYHHSRYGNSFICRIIKRVEKQARVQNLDFLLLPVKGTLSCTLNVNWETLVIPIYAQQIRNKIEFCDIIFLILRLISLNESTKLYTIRQMKIKIIKPDNVNVDHRSIICEINNNIIMEWSVFNLTKHMPI